MSALDVFTRYDQALAAGDFATIGSVFAKDVVWHQPGTHELAGTYSGQEAVFGLLGALTERSAGSLVIATKTAMENGDLVAATVHFTATTPAGASIDMRGIDLFRVEGEHIAEVWLFSADQAAEDRFWSGK